MFPTESGEVGWYRLETSGFLRLALGRFFVSKEQVARNKEQFFNMLSTTNPLYIKADMLAKEIYRLTNTFPKYELYGMTSQIRRSGLSVVLNSIEGFSRLSDAEYRRFLIMAFGSLKETKYLLYFAHEQQYISADDYQRVIAIAEEVAKILWSIIKK